MLLHALTKLGRGLAEVFEHSLFSGNFSKGVSYQISGVMFR